MANKHYSDNVLNWNLACDQQSAIDNVDFRLNLCSVFCFKHGTCLTGTKFSLKIKCAFCGQIKHCLSVKDDIDNDYINLLDL